MLGGTCTKQLCMRSEPAAACMANMASAAAHRVRPIKLAVQHAVPTRLKAGHQAPGAVVNAQHTIVHTMRNVDGRGSWATQGRGRAGG
jgi:hypothetical protein